MEAREIHVWTSTKKLQMVGIMIAAVCLHEYIGLR
jgi:hypothetical protein